MAKGRGTRRQLDSEDDSPDPSSQEEELYDSNDEDDDEVSEGNSEKYNAFTVDSDGEATKGRRIEEATRKRKKQDVDGDLAAILEKLDEQKQQNAKILVGYERLVDEVNNLKVARREETSTSQTHNELNLHQGIAEAETKKKSPNQKKKEGTHHRNSKRCR